MASVYEVTRVYNERLKRRQQRVLSQMLADWRRIEADLVAQAEKWAALLLDAEARDLTAQVISFDPKTGRLLPPELGEYPADWLYRQERVTKLLAQTRAEIERLSAKYTPYIEGQARAAALDGARLAAEQLRLGTAFGTRLSVAAVEAIAAETRLGPLAELFLKIDTEGIFRDALLRGIANGTNPRAVAREVARATNLAREKTLTIARTEMARAQRSATYDAYRKLDVAQWQWLCARDATTCAACWSMDGETFDQLEEVDDHPNGRCAIVPVVGGESLAEVSDKMGAWDRLSASDQTRILGPTRYDLVQKGDLTLSKYDEALNPTGIGKLTDTTAWGTSIRVAPLAS